MLWISLSFFGALALPAVVAAKPNIVLILADDQDHRMHSLSHQPILQDLLVKQGTLFTNHFTTTSNCCPSRASLLRGQASHNTNITHVRAPGGGYLKWLVGEEDHHYLPQWLGKLGGYKTEYIGKLLNGQDMYNYKIRPKGWDHIDYLLQPYTYKYNTVVMSANGETPMYYKGWHQTDVVRAKALARLKHLTSQNSPWFLGIAPTTPHIQGEHPPIPLERHKNDFPDLKAPRPENFNASEKFTAQKPSYLKKLKPLPAADGERADYHYRSRIQAIQGLDEIVQDVVDYLKKAGQLDNTYIIYTSDNGYHIGAHRLLAGKALPYIEDTNIPLVVRGPGIPAGATSKIASTHIDFMPTFLDIAGVKKTDLPDLFDGRSLIEEWKHADSEVDRQKVDREIVNVEFWGTLNVEIQPKAHKQNSYKTMRILSEDSAWLYSRWCTGDTELYDTKSDPYELRNLAIKPVKQEHQQVMNRLNALLLVTKSCVGPTCRNPWPVLKPANDSLPTPQSLSEAMHSKYNDHFASYPQVQFKECLNIQLPSNETPFLPHDARNDLGTKHRKSTDNFDKGKTGDCSFDSIKEDGHFGTKAQRHKTLEDMNKDARKLKDHELPGASCHYIGVPGA